MEFNLAEKLAVVKMIYTMVMADNVVHPMEIEAIRKLTHIINFESNHIQVAQNLEHGQAVGILRKMSLAKRDSLELILKDIAQCDGFVHLKETDVLEGVFAAEAG